MLDQLQKDIHYSFRQVKYLRSALTHSSYCNENLENHDGAGVEHNERLEFLGDAVLELAVSSLLYKNFPAAREGRMTTLRSGLVNQTSLADIARRLKLDTYLLLGKGEEIQGGRKRDSLLSDALEALFGAIYLDGGFARTYDVVKRLFKDRCTDETEKNLRKNNKSLLEELSQKLFQARPFYGLLESRGPEHAKEFKVSLMLPDGRKFMATGPSLKRAEQKVAGMALAELSESQQCDS